MDIREIERVIDHIHEELPIFKQAKEQLQFELIATFEDSCSLIAMSSMLNAFALSKIPEQMDALNMALLWVERCAKGEPINKVTFHVPEERYIQCASLLNDYAFPYNTICSGYISYSRKRMVASINDHIVTFDMADSDNKSAWNDILREVNESSLTSVMDWVDPVILSKAIGSLNNKISVENGMICYEVSSDILSPFVELANLQWDATKTLPNTWVFDKFSLEEYRRFWIQVTALCHLHFWGCIKIGDPQIRINNGVIIQSKQMFSNSIAKLAGISQETATAIIEYITYDAKLKNTDIMYQPILNIDGEMLVIAPMLFIGAKPERNLLSLVGLKNNDAKHSKEVNDLEGLMIQDLEAVVQENDDVRIAKHKELDSDLPDVDFAIVDKITKTAIVCELKWFAASDSTKEVYAKEDEITHGCNQVDQIMGYALRKRNEFFKRVFDVDDGDNFDLFCCVIAKHNIRTQHKYVPVIDLATMLELLTTKPLDVVFNLVRNHQYEYTLPENASITYREIPYGGFLFRIPAICFGEDVV